MEKTRTLLELMADLEARIGKLYERFATEFRSEAPLAAFWDALAEEELRHAERLSQAPPLPVEASVALDDSIAALEEVVLETERRAARPLDLEEALRITADLEEAEVARLHEPLAGLGAAGAALARDPALLHRLRPLVERVIDRYGSPQLRRRTAWRHFLE